MRCHPRELFPTAMEVFNVHRHRRSDAAQHRHRFLAAPALVRREHVGQAAGHLHDGRPLPREVPGRPGRGDQRQERAGLDILTHGDFHCDEDLAGRSWHHYPLQRWAGFEGDYLQSEETRSEWLKYPPGTLLNEIYTGWRWPRVVDKIEHRPLDYAKIWRMAQAKTPQAGPLRHLLLAGDGPVPRHPHAQVQGQPRGRSGTWPWR